MRLRTKKTSKRFWHMIWTRTRRMMMKSSLLAEDSGVAVRVIQRMERKMPLDYRIAQAPSKNH